MPIPFTQYLRPDGRKIELQITRSPEIEAIAQEIRARGCTFECEVLNDAYETVSLTVASPHDDEGDIGIVLVPNGDEGKIGEGVDELVRRVIAKL